MGEAMSAEMRPPVAPPAIVDRRVQKTYWHLEGQRRMPSDYELVSTRLLHHPEKGFSVDVPAAAWRARFGPGQTLRATDWEAFSDPRETTYASYVAAQSRKATLTSGLFHRLEAGGYDERLPEEAAAILETFVFPLRYPLHAMQMVSAYVGHLAPSSKVAIAAAFRRRTRRAACSGSPTGWRSAGKVSRGPAALDEAARRAWQDAPSWQPLRRALGSSWSRTTGARPSSPSVCVKPAFDAWAMTRLPLRAERAGDAPGRPLLLAERRLRVARSDGAKRSSRAASAGHGERPVARGVGGEWRPLAAAAMLPLLQGSRDDGPREPARAGAARYRPASTASSRSIASSPSRPGTARWAGSQASRRQTRWGGRSSTSYRSSNGAELTAWRTC